MSPTNCLYYNERNEVICTECILIIHIIMETMMDLVLDGFGLSSLLSSLFSSYGEEIIIAATMETVADKKHINCAFLLAKNPLI
jgi:hypothetical protein